MNIILASGSPRRRELLSMLGLSFTVQPAKGEEKAAEGLSPDELVCALAEGKAKEVSLRADADDMIIAADTIVWHEGTVFGKPKSEEDARRMLESLSGACHSVYTGVCIIKDGVCLSRAECTKVRFKELSAEEISAYIATGEPMDKAGAYGIQGKASVFVEGIEGDYFNVMGLPLCRLGKMLNELGVSLL